MRTKRKLLREAWDLETTGLILYGPRAARPFSYSCFDGEHDIIIDRLDTGNPTKKLTEFKHRLATPAPKVFHNLKYDYSVLKQNGYTINGPLHCTMIMNQLLNNLRRSDALDQIAWDLCGFRSRTDDEVYQAGKESGNYQRIPHSLMHEYQVEDAMRGKLLDDILWPQIAKDPVLTQIYQYEIRLILVTTDMEARGVWVDKSECRELIAWLEREVHDIQQQVYEITGEYINLNSGDQVGHLLYDVLELPILKYTDTGKPAVDKYVFTDLKEKCADGWHTPIDPVEILSLIQRYRSYSNGVSTINKYMELSDIDEGFVHTSFNTNYDVTGRQASSRPNMQNVSKAKALANPYPVPARRCFGPRLNHFWDLYDYAQIELRLIILLCGDMELLKLYQADPLFDLHTFFACIWFDIDKSELKKEMRDASKNANFALPYGAKLDTVAKQLVLPPEVVNPRLQYIKERFPGYTGWEKNITKIVKGQRLDPFLESVSDRLGIEPGTMTVRTIFGRKMYVPRNRPHAAADYIIQGTASDILKRAQVRIGEWLQEVDFVDHTCYPVLTVHDELVFEKHNTLRRAGKDRPVHYTICKHMLDMPEVEIPMVVERERTRTTWNDAKEFGNQITLNMLREALRGGE